MEKNLYVNYLNRPKRAKYNADSEVVLQQILQASIWNSCLSFKKDEPKPIRRAVSSYGEKPNLKAEMKYDTLTNQKSSKTCECAYRSQFCKLHNCSKNCHLNKCDKEKNAKRTNRPNANILNHRNLPNLLHSRNNHVKNFEAIRNDGMCSRFIKSKFPYRFKNRFFPYSGKKYPVLISGVSFRQNGFHSLSHHSSVVKSKYQSHKLVKNCSSLSKSQPTSVCMVQADILCSCVKVPVPSSDLAFSSVDCQSYCMRRCLAACIVARSSMKLVKKRASFPVSIPQPLKKQIESWCEVLLAKHEASISCHLHDKTSASANEKGCKYSFYSKKESNSTFQRIDADISCSFDLLCNVCLLSFIENHLLHKSTDNSTTPNGKVKNKLPESSVFSNYPPCCYTAPVNGSCFYTNGVKTNSVAMIHDMPVPEKRISSRLQQKRDSGLQSPFSDDYIVEVPVSKKFKKPKLSHPYSHKLFWNFYESHSLSEKHKWRNLSRTYYSHYTVKSRSVSTEKQNKVSELKSVLPSHNGLLNFDQDQRSGSLTRCPYCDSSFKSFSDKQRTSHINRHHQQWPTFQAPQFFPRNWQAKLRANQEEVATKSRHKRPVAPLKEKPHNLLNEKTRNLVSNAIRKRPTARKSYGAW